MNRFCPLVLLSALLAGCGGPKPVAVDTPRARLEKLGIVKSSALASNKENFTATLSGPPTDAIWDVLAQADGLTSLHLSQRWMTDADFERVGKLKGLRWLEVEDANDFTERGLSALAGLDQLSSLRVFNTLLNTKAAAELRKLPQLRDVTLRNCGITDAGVRELAAISTIEELRLIDNPDVGDAGMKPLGQCLGLTSLNLEGTRVTDQGLKELRGLTKLELLTLSDTAVTDRGLEHVRELKSLLSLDLSRTAVTDAGLDLLHGCENLISLDLYDTKVTEEGVRRLSAARPECMVNR
jgi:internalin A